MTRRFELRAGSLADALQGPSEESLNRGSEALLSLEEKRREPGRNHSSERSPAAEEGFVAMTNEPQFVFTSLPLLQLSVFERGEAENGGASQTD